MKLSILSPERKLAEGIDVEEVTLPGSEGQIQLLPGHAPMVGTLLTGVFQYKSYGKALVEGVISTGFFEVRDDQVHVMVETLELKNEINLERARTAQKKAEEHLKSTSLEEGQFRKYQLKLQRALIRQQVAQGSR